MFWWDRRIPRLGAGEIVYHQSARGFGTSHRTSPGLDFPIYKVGVHSRCSRNVRCFGPPFSLPYISLRVAHLCLVHHKGPESDPLGASPSLMNTRKRGPRGLSIAPRPGSLERSCHRGFDVWGDPQDLVSKVLPTTLWPGRRVALRDFTLEEKND